MRDVAQSYSALGQYQDALDMNQKALELYDRGLPDYHPNTCEVYMVCSLLKASHFFCVFFRSQVRLWAILL
jgi:tetratricopeptide (TPR) repeat protein